MKTIARPKASGLANGDSLAERRSLPPNVGLYDQLLEIRKPAAVPHRGRQAPTRSKPGFCVARRAAAPLACCLSPLLVTHRTPLCQAATSISPSRRSESIARRVNSRAFSSRPREACLFDSTFNIASSSPDLPVGQSTARSISLALFWNTASR
jgi:hypothetical protein